MHTEGTRTRTPDSRTDQATKDSRARSLRMVRSGHCARVHREVIVNGNDEAHESTRCIVPGPRTWRRVWSARAHTGRAAHGSFFLFHPPTTPLMAGAAGPALGIWQGYGLNGLATAEEAHGHTTLLGQQMWHAWMARMLVRHVRSPIRSRRVESVD